MHQVFTLSLLTATALFLCSCASKPEQPSTTSYNQQVSRQADDEFNRTLGDKK
jgi:ABC-type uncharacterized transport system auxiliary subunit